MSQDSENGHCSHVEAPQVFIAEAAGEAFSRVEYGILEGIGEWVRSRNIDESPQAFHGPITCEEFPESEAWVEIQMVDGRHQMRGFLTDALGFVTERFHIDYNPDCPEDQPEYSDNIDVFGLARIRLMLEGGPVHIPYGDFAERFDDELHEHPAQPVAERVKRFLRRR